MSADTVTQTARQALGSACSQVEEARQGDDVDGVRPTMVARPTDVDQVAEVLRAAAAHRLTVVLRGRGTKLAWGTAPRSADVLLDVSGLDQVLDHAAGDLIAVAQAGATLADLQHVVAGGGQRLALDETLPGASVGGTLATNTSGPGRMAVGTARDLVIGMTVVRADGVVAKSGGRVVKNVAGYDLGKLMIGSHGTLAVIVDATFRLHPLPQARRWISVEADTPAAAAAQAGAVIHSQCVPAAVEVHQPPQGRPSVHVLLEGRPDGVQGRAETVLGLLGSAAQVTDAAPADWGVLPWPTGDPGAGRATALKLTFVLSGLADVLAAARQCPAAVTLRGSAGAGVLHAAVAPGSATDDVATCVAQLREVCRRLGGTVVVLDAAPAVKSAVDVWGPVAAIDLMRRVKDQFDPDHRLAPGRFIGGI